MSSTISNGQVERSVAPLAIVGIGCRLPGAHGRKAFWELLTAGIDSITEIPPDRWIAQHYRPADDDQPGKIYTPWGGFVDNLDKFDPQFFGISPREAAVMDPQQRLLLEVTWEAFEDAGFPAHNLAGTRTGVYVGISSHDYNDILSQPSERAPKNAYIALGTTLSIAANRISFAFDLHGPSIAVDTACSSSLVALHLACQSIRNGESSQAVVAGVNVILRPETTINFCYASMLSPDGRCKAFDAGANGYVRAEGAGAIIVKPLEAALRDRDTIYAVVLGSAVNQDGHSESIAVPSGAAQQEVFKSACLAAGVDPVQVQYVEAHGTGTAVGDPIEASAIGSVYGAAVGRVEKCVIGSVKSNIGHLEPASGIVGVIKTCLALYHGVIPASLHFKTPNPKIAFEQLKLRVPTCPEPWPQCSRRIAGVNSFGFGGTNAHVLLGTPLERVEEDAKKESSTGSILLPVSARSEEALRANASALSLWLRQSATEHTGDIAYTAAVRRSHHAHRVAFIADGCAEFADRLEDFVAAGKRDVGTQKTQLGAAPRIAFVFTGMGPQWWGMGRELLETELVFRDAVQEIDALFRKIAGWSLLESMLDDEMNSRIDLASVAQPAIFALQVALAALWRSWGIRPDAVVGHSVGEVAAAFTAGALTLQDAVTVIYHRSRLQELTRGTGGMLAIGMSVEEALPLIEPYKKQIAIAAVNSPRSITISGNSEILDIIASGLGEQVFYRKLRVDIPYHGPGMDPLEGELRISLSGLKPTVPTLSMVSSVTGNVNPGVLNASYWWRNVREAVTFASATTALLEMGFEYFLEVGPHPVLGGSIAETATKSGKSVVTLASLRRAEKERQVMLATLGKLYVSGQSVDWSALYPSGRVINLPTYPWQREYHWRESEEGRQVRLGLSDTGGGGVLGLIAHPILGAPIETAASDHVWQCRLDITQQHKLLEDHQVQGTVVFPAAGYLDMAVAALGTKAGTVERVEFHKPLFLNRDTKKTIQLVLTPGQGLFEVFGREVDGNWTLHASGAVRVEAHRGELVDLTAVKLRCASTFDADQWYSDFKTAGLIYGPAFRCVEKVWVGDGESLGRLRKPSSSSGRVFNAGLLDGCFQVLRGAINDRTGLYLPRRVEKFRVYQLFEHIESDFIWSHVHLTGSGSEEVRVDIYITTESGEPVADVLGLTCQALAGTESLTDRLDDLLYAYEWNLQPISKSNDLSDKLWVVFSTCNSGGLGLATGLIRSGEKVVTVSTGSNFALSIDGYATVRDECHEDWEQLIALLPECRGIICDVSRSREQTTDSLLDAGYLQVLPIIKAASNAKNPPRVWIITRGGQPIGNSIPDVSMAAVWGLGRVASAEYPKTRCSRIDLSLDPGDDEIASLVTELNTDGVEDEVSFRGSDRYVHRFRCLESKDLRPLTPRPYQLKIGTPGLIASLAASGTIRRSPGPGEIEIEVRAAGLNFKDVAKCLNLLAADTLDGTWSGRRLGLECSGIVTAVGISTDQFAPGDEVIAVVPDCFRTHVVVSVKFAIRKPSHLTFPQAAGLPVAYMTAYHALHRLANLQRGERVLIHAAAGGVGLAAVHLALRAGAEVFATAGSPAKRTMLAGLGVHAVMDSRSLSFAEEILQITGGTGIDVVLNSLTGAAIPQSLALLRTGGRFVEIGKRDIERNSRLGLRPFQNDIAFFGVDLDRLWISRPEITEALFKTVVELALTHQVPALPVEVFSTSEASGAFRHMMQAKHTGKIVLDFTDKTPAIRIADEDTISFRPDRTYLITGGAGGFGLATAHWLVSRGVRHLALMGRSGVVGNELERSIDAMRASGINISVFKANVSDPIQLDESLALIRLSMPPLAGVFHAAAVFDDGIIPAQTPERFRRVFDPKAMGAWHLHQLTQADALDHFVLFSSVAAVIGNRGQANYAAANQFLDALANHRKALGQPVLAVNWTAVADAGYVARNHGVRDHLEKLGLTPLPANRMLCALGELLQTDIASVAVMKLNVSRWAISDPAARLPRFELIIGNHLSGSHFTGIVSAAERVRSAGVLDRPAIITEILAESAAIVLGIPVVCLETVRPLTEYGLDSLMSAELSTRVHRELGVDIPPMAFLRGETLSGLGIELARLFGVRESGTETHSTPVLLEVQREFDWAAETLLDEMIVPEGQHVLSASARIAFLTGATGFLGAFLLRDLLRLTEFHVVCLVRANSSMEGATRIQQTLEKYRLWDPIFHGRFEAVCGDLAVPRLGLSLDDWERLVRDVDAIYHNGARLNLLQTYNQLKPSNVSGTVEVLRLASAIRTKPVHYISSLGVFDLPNPPTPVTFAETDRARDIALLRFGYTQSKAVAEELVHAAASRGLPVTIYRPGLVNACSESGAYTIEDFPAKFIKSWIENRSAPDLNQNLLLTPVDFVSRAIVSLSRDPDSFGQTFHLVNPTPVPMVILQDLIHSSGYPIETISFTLWQERLAMQAKLTGDPSLSAVLSFTGEGEEGLPLWPQPNIGFRIHETLSRLSVLGVTCPRVDKRLVQSCLDYFRSIGFLREAQMSKATV